MDYKKCSYYQTCLENKISKCIDPRCPVFEEEDVSIQESLQEKLEKVNRFRKIEIILEELMKASLKRI